MITCETLVSQPFQPAEHGLALRRRQRCNRSSSEVGTPVYIYSARAIRDGVSRHRRGVRRLSARDPLRAQGQLDARDRCACCERSAAAPTPTPAARSQVALRAGFAPATSCSPASARRATSSSSRSRTASARSTPSRPASSIASRRSRAALGRDGARGAARQPRHRRAEPSEHLHRPEDATSSASPLQDARAIYRERRGLAGPAVRRRPHPHRLADHDAPSRCGAPPRRWSSLALELRDDGVRARARRPRRRPRHRLRGHADDRRRPSTRRRCCRSCGARAAGRARAGPRRRRPRPARSSRASSTPSAIPDGRRFAVLDAGMTELMRPALYGSYHRIVPVQPRAGAGERRGTSSARSARAATCSRRDRDAAAARGRTTCVAVLDAGAYGAVMGSNYNRRLLRAEVLVDDGAVDASSAAARRSTTSSRSRR